MKLLIQNVSKNYGAKQALHPVSIQFDKGITGLLGPNGAGKSTLMRMIATVDTPSGGEIIYNNVDIRKNPKVIRSELGYLPQSFGIYPNMNPVEFLEYMAAIKNLNMHDAKKQIDKLLEALNLQNARKQQIGGFSGGMKQRVGIAQALLNDPKILIVDEPTVGLDPEERIQFRNLLSSIASEKIIIFSTHIVTDIESVAPNIVIMSSGSLVADTTPERLIKQVEGKVWRSVVDMSNLMNVQKDYLVSNMNPCSKGIRVRIIADECPLPGSELVLPTLEDAYLYTTGRKMK